MYNCRPLLTHADADIALCLDKIRVGNLMLHLCGNLSQWVLEGLGGRAYERHRSEEFSAARGLAPQEAASRPDRGLSRVELLAKLATVVDECRQVIAALGETELAAPRTIQGYSTDGLLPAASRGVALTLRGG